MEVLGIPGTNLKLNAGIVKQFLVEFIRNEVSNAGFEKGLVGLSGGVDSALAVSLAAEALGREHILAVMMPYKASSPESLTDARSIVSQLGIRSETVDITPMVDAYILKNNITDNVRKGNVMARQRMIVLYDLSARDSALVIGTSNKTEILLGYGTHFGDTACAINPIGDLYKTQVWQLAEVIGVPQNIIEKKPSADLWHGQTDEEELGFSYLLVDQLLYKMIDMHFTDDELIASGFEKNFIENVRQLIKRNQFKRRTPLIATISRHPAKDDFHNSKDWGR